MIQRVKKLSKQSCGERMTLEARLYFDGETVSFNRDQLFFR